MDKFKVSIVKKDGITVEGIIEAENPGSAFLDFASEKGIMQKEMNSIFVSNINI